LLRFVLLLRKRVHLPERLPPALEAFCALCELVAVVAFGPLVGACMLEAAPCFVCLGIDARDLDIDRRDARGRARQLLAQPDPRGAGRALSLAARAGTRPACSDTRA